MDVWHVGIAKYCCIFLLCCDALTYGIHSSSKKVLPTVPQVDLYENGTIAIVEAVSPELGNRVQRVRVQLPGTSQELLQRFREKNVDFAAHSNTEDGGAVFLNLLGMSPPLKFRLLCFPVIDDHM